MKVEIKDGNVVITAPISKQTSKSGKSIVIASSRGNKETEAVFEGKPVIVGLNCYVEN